MKEDASKEEPFRSNSSTCNHKEVKVTICQHTVVSTEIIAALRSVIISQHTNPHTVTFTLTSFQTGFNSLSIALVFFFSPVNTMRFSQKPKTAKTNRVT